MQIPATTHGTVDQGGSSCGPEKFEGFARVQTRSTSPKFSAISVRWNGGLLPRYCWGSEEKLTLSSGRLNFVNLISPDNYTGYTLFEPDNSSPYAQFYRQSEEPIGSREWVLWAGPPAAPKLYPKHPARLGNDAEYKLSMRITRDSRILPHPLTERAFPWLIERYFPGFGDRSTIPHRYRRTAGSMDVPLIGISASWLHRHNVHSLKSATKIVFLHAVKGGVMASRGL
ncbi:hypothetical protein PCH_Pc17g00060 [Penicillium rubens Wisconsin 54-1255]|uniref:Uncharacterized protein n=1 Tax=Penicillium rubens (strain ATCC 28089 / DSM 1075 / NRRL 1951 / Wisconsin 54-1255) TaxID=500485 RepID=B6HAU3_PENRW|nr:hypothetical protein PCH_Pc17g00060 [Penicillium rubens Wisconsin 54-1255]